MKQQDLLIDIYKKIGLPAACEQLAEENAELAQAGLKLARKVRCENPTPKTMEDIKAQLHEEAADVLVCISLLEKAGILDPNELDEQMDAKTVRWAFRLGLV